MWLHTPWEDVRDNLFLKMKKSKLQNCVLSFKKSLLREFPGTLGLHAFTAEGPGSISGQGTKIPQAVQQGKKKEKKRNIY